MRDDSVSGFPRALSSPTHTRERALESRMNAVACVVLLALSAADAARGDIDIEVTRKYNPGRWISTTNRVRGLLSHRSTDHPYGPTPQITPKITLIKIINKLLT